MDRKRFVEDTARMLLEQGVYAVSENARMCRYRTPTGMKCALGLHIPDNIYHSNMEHKVATKLLLLFPALKEYLSNLYGPISDEDAEFLWRVQTALHDRRAIPVLLEQRPILSIEESLQELSPYL